MKQIIIFLLLVCPCFVQAQTQAQTEDPKISGWLIGVETRASGVFLNDSQWKLSSMDLDLTIGYGFNRRLSLYVPLTFAANMFDRKGVKTYETAGLLGAGVGYSPIHTSRCQLEIVGRLGGTLGGNWQYIYYDGGVRLGLPNSIYIGVGVRYYSQLKGVFGNHCNFYGAVGYRFNRYRSR